MLNHLIKELDERFEISANRNTTDFSGTVAEISLSKYSMAFGAYYLINKLGQVSSFDEMKGMIQSGFTGLYIPEMNSNLFKIPQEKQYGKTLGDHLIFTFLAYNNVWSDKYCGHINNKVIGLACFLHDIGKVHDVNNHAKIGADIVCKFSLRYMGYFKNKIDDCTDLYNIVLNHMRPLGYQRGEKWSDSAVEKFIIDCGNKDVALSTVVLAMCDKFASTRNKSYLEPLEELCTRIIHITDSAKKSES